ncbi:MAG: indole-3-glycerol phosphate synthase TrpC [Limisphaerales bacterium]
MHILDKIVAQKRKEVAHLPAGPVSAEAIRAARPKPRDFLAALQRPPRGAPALIAEIKKASPSAGVICADFDPVRIARAYEAGGASCLSVLTDESFFQGSLENLRKAREAVKLPLLRKDFIIDERQILESAENGADAILLIVRILSDAQLEHFYRLATEGGLAALVETHDEKELERALAAGANLIGINNRNLDTFVVDLAVTERLAAGLPDRFVVAESGLHTRTDVERVRRAGAQAVLVGESLMREPAGIAAKIAELVGVK